jgi:hypothetical protein
MAHDIDPGDNCDVWGNVYATADAPAVVNPPSSTPTTAANPINRGPVESAPAPAMTQPTQPDDPRRSPFLKRVATDVAVQRQLAAVKVLEADFQSLLKVNEERLRPELKIAQLRNFISSTANLDEIAEAHRWLATLESPGTAHVTESAARAAWAATAPLKAGVVKLVELGIQVIDRLAQEVVLDETEFFAKYAMAREVTSLSRKALAVKGELQRTLSGVRGDDPGFPTLAIKHPPHGEEFRHAIQLFEQ